MFITMIILAVSGFLGGIGMIVAGAIQHMAPVWGAGIGVLAVSIIGCVFLMCKCASSLAH